MAIRSDQAEAREMFIITIYFCFIIPLRGILRNLSGLDDTAGVDNSEK